MVILTQGRTEDLLREWQERLRLTDWNIALHDNETFWGMEECRGKVDYSEPSKEAIIHLLDEDQFVSKEFVYDKERSIIHELLHIKFCLLDESGNDTHDRLLHQMIEELAKAFVDAKRAGYETTATEENEDNDDGGDNHSDSRHAHISLMPAEPDRTEFPSV